MVRIGAHEREGDPLGVAKATGAEVIQFFLGDPQGWGAPAFPGGLTVKANHLESRENPRVPKPPPAGHFVSLSPVVARSTISPSPSAGATR